METKEAIEFVQNKWVTYLDKQEIENKNKVIELLQRGEKFEKMFEEIIEANKVLKMCMDFDELKEKYFPKEE